MLEGLKRNGHEQLAVTSIWTDGEFSKRLQELRIEEKQMPFGIVIASLSPLYIKWTANCLIRLPSLWHKWNQAVRTFRPDLVLFTSSKQALLVLPWIRNVPSLLIEYTNIVATRNTLWLYRQLAPKLSGFVAVSDFMRGHLHSLGAPSEKIHVIKSGVFSVCELNQQERPRNLDGRPRVGIVGQIAPNKGHDGLVEAVRILKTRGADVVVEVFGDGDPVYVSTLKEKIDDTGLTQTWNWNGYETDKDKIFGSIDICVVPSSFGDPFPTVAMEAGAYGLPVIASRAGGLPEIVEHGVTGFLVERNNTKELADRIYQLMQDPDQAKRMGEAGRQKILRNFTVEKMVSEFEELFRKTVW